MNRRTRRDLLTSWLDAFRSVGGAAGKGRSRSLEKLLRPPGALQPDDAFEAACTGCGDCVPACPIEAVFMVEAGDERKLPAIDPAARACHLCTDLPCIAACPDGALADPAGPDKVRIGIARVDPRRCVTFRQQPCDACFNACPYPHQAIMVIGGRPLVGSGACTGCGLCEYACPEEPKAIEVVPERALIPGLRIPRSEYEAG